jgi:hypothetical protein
LEDEKGDRIADEDYEAGGFGGSPSTSGSSILFQKSSAKTKAKVHYTTVFSS